MTQTGSCFSRQLKILLWKNYLLKKRNKKQFLYEIIAPIYFVVIIAGLKVGIKPAALDPILSFPEHSLDDFLLNDNSVLYISPASQPITDIMDNVLSHVSSGIQYQLFNSPAEMYEAYQIMETAGNHSNIIGVNFADGSLTNMSYTLRFKQSDVINSDSLYALAGQCRSEDGLSRDHCSANTYLFSGFLHLKSILDWVLLQVESNNPNFPKPELIVELMPKDEHSSDIIVIQAISSIYLVLAYSPFILSLTVNLVAEKEKKIKEGMRMMGMSDVAFWFSWGIIYAAIIAVVTLIVTAILVAITFYQNSNFLIVFLIMFFYGMSIVCMAFIFTPFFSKAQTAGALASFGTLILSMLYFPVSMTRTDGPDGPESSIPMGGQWALSLLSPVAFALAIDRSIYLDVSEGGLTFDTINKGQFPVAYSLVMLIIDCIFYAVLAFWLDSIVPNEHGLRRPPWFCFTRSFWAGHSDKPSAALLSNQEDLEATIPESMEPVAATLRDKNHLRIYNIHKKYKNKQKKIIKSVDGITMQLYEGQITALLGHNGAGKTTLINMLTGMCPPTDGTAVIYGYDISDSNDMTALRGITGVCPQHDILFEDLTCREHLEIYGVIKGVHPNDITKQINKSLQEVSLTDKIDDLTKELSGGQKRKLSVAIALIGDPKVIFLDEPTAGMDPFSRRHIWSVLKNRREGKLILLTTHFMDEADILADRKAFMSRGKLQCVGSSLFLKNKFGLGYHLSMVLEGNALTVPIGELIKSHISENVTFRQHGQELIYTLPLDSVDRFPGLFGALEETVAGQSKSEALGISTYGISMTTLEEVFLKLGDGAEDRDNDTNVMEMIQDTRPTTLPQAQPLVHAMNIQEEGSEINIEESPLDWKNAEEPVNLTWQRFLAMMKMRWTVVIRNKQKLFFVVILPIIFITGGAALMRILDNTIDKGGEEPPVLPFLTDMYIDDGQVLDVALGNHPAVDPNLLNDFTEGLRDQDIGYDSSYNFSTLHYDRPHHVGIDVLKLNTPQNIQSRFQLYYNDTSIHSIVIASSIVTNTMQTMLTSAPSSLVVSSQSWPDRSGDLPGWDGSLFGSIMLLGMAFSVIPAGFAIQVIYEREHHIRAQLRISGMTTPMYWVCVFVSDITQFSITSFATLVVLLAFQTASIMNAGAFTCIVLLYILYMPVTLMFAYLLSFLFDKHETGQQVLGNMFSFMAFIPYIVVMMLDLQGFHTASDSLHYTFIFIDPPYGVFGGLYYIVKVHLLAYVAGTEDDIPFDEYFKWESNILICFIAPFVQGVILLFLMRIAEVRSTGGSTKAAMDGILPCTGSQNGSVGNIQEPYQAAVGTVREPHFDDVSQDEDSDVAAERRRLCDYQPSPGASHQPVIVVRDLKKVFTKKNAASKSKSCFVKQNALEKTHLAVQKNTFSVQAGEVMGLLGPNGAGKTTTLNMIMAEVTPTAGQVYVNGYDIRSNISDAFQAMGYCPQHNALWEDVTLYEHLELYALISGVPKSKISMLANFYIKNLKLEEHSKKIAKSLSGGTKRKLSFAMSMLGYPKVVLLDEPSTGMDPKSKRFLWDTISSCFHDSYRGAILTTHYMDEADALCSNIAIMVNGQMKCLGSGQHLKNKFGSGYLLEIKLKSSCAAEEDSVAVDRLDKFVNDQFPDASQIEKFGERMIYKIPQSNITSLSATFTALEEERQTLEIEEYSFSQSTLEQVFLEFAKTQVEDEDTVVLSVNNTAPPPNTATIA